MEHPKHPWETNHVLVRRDEVLERASMDKSAIVHQLVFLVRINMGTEMIVIVGLGLRLGSARHTSA
jgi:hypothetical protein